ncbi:hypothetical protein DERF_003925 [Dermatophagoides farinae]|uniref:Uncharacterized protein n=1 Tax=Dermatophagoides farinae TaxID=6954 RepID=A0A922IG35_DERFA|nr:hypothetical protein DERF_003925 [Dermatophagoides farinae]
MSQTKVSQIFHIFIFEMWRLVDVDDVDDDDNNDHYIGEEEEIPNWNFFSSSSPCLYGWIQIALRERQRQRQQQQQRQQ